MTIRPDPPPRREAAATTREAPILPTPMLRILAVAALGTVVLAGAGRAEEAAPAVPKPPPVAHFMLANGLEMVVIPDHRTPVVTHTIWYKVGAADEPPGKSGIAHFLEHLMFKGTAKNPAGRFSQAVAALGGQENASTSADYTSYYQRVARDQLETVMAMEADRMTGLVLTDANVLPERNVVLEEQNQRIANNPAARLGEQVQAALYLNHPYGRPVIGWRHEIEALDREDALAFYRRFYAPNNAVLVVAGDVAPDAAKAIAERTYGRVPRQPDVGPRARPQEPAADDVVRQVTLADPRVAQPSLQRSYLVPSYPSARDKPDEAAALDVLANVLGAGANSRLYRALVADKGLATSAGGWYLGTVRDASRLAVFASPKPGVGLPELEAALDAVLADVVANGVTAEEVGRTKRRMVADYVYAQDNQVTLSQVYGIGLVNGQTIAEIDARPGRIAAVTPDAVAAAARRYLDRRRAVTGYLIKAEGRPGEKRS